MERYYLVRTVETATERNEDFPGEEHLSYFGKGEKMLFSAGHKDGAYNRNWLDARTVREYGYTRECDAKRNWIYKHPDINEHPGMGAPMWKTATSIATVWVRHDGTVTILA